MIFVDEIKIYAKGGKGGNGCISFRREKFVAYGGPDGGRGGNGSNIILRASKKYNTLLKFYYQPHLRGNNGEHGGSSRKYGLSGKDVIVEVPIGTQVYDVNNKLLADLILEKQEILIAKGGAGGVGNAGSRSHVKEQNYNPGEEGEDNTLFLKLKIIADVGIIGLPNAGKSTFLSMCSNAHPKIADYEFTTLCPQIGMVKLDNSRDFIIADIPGLIEGAHNGLGLGHTFLKHIERCKTVLHLIDCMHDDVIKVYNIVREELKQYNELLIDKKEIVAVSRCDLLDADMVEEKIKLLEEYTKHKVYRVTVQNKPHEILNQLYNQLGTKDSVVKYDPLS